MKKNKVKAQLRKIATRDAMEKRRNRKSSDPFLSMMAANKNRTPVSTERYNYEDEEDRYYGDY